MKTFITEDEIDKALDYLRDNASAAAQARANRVYIEEFRKTVKAQQMKLDEGIPVSAQERNAYASQAYQDHLEVLKDAVMEDEKHRFMMSAAQAKIDAWRTQESNLRNMQRVG